MRVTRRKGRRGYWRGKAGCPINYGKGENGKRGGRGGSIGGNATLSLPPSLPILALSLAVAPFILGRGKRYLVAPDCDGTRNKNVRKIKYVFFFFQRRDRGRRYGRRGDQGREGMEGGAHFLGAAVKRGGTRG